MKTLVDLIVLNWAQMFILVLIALVFLKKEALLAKAKEEHQSVAFTRFVMAAFVILAGVGMMLISSLGLRVEQQKHHGEMQVKDTEIRLLHEEIEHLKSK